MNRKPLVIAPDPFKPLAGAVIEQQLQPGDDLDIPLECRFASLKNALSDFVVSCLSNGIPVPASLLAELGIN